MTYRRTNWQPTLKDAQGNIQQKGTPLTASYLNNIEEGIVGAARKEELEEARQHLADIAVNVKSFGAVGDGKKDNSFIIQSMLDSGIKEIYFPSGNFIVEGLIIKSPVIFRGKSKEETKLILKSGSLKGILENRGYVPGFKAENITFDENENASSGRKNVIKFLDVYPLTFNNVDFIKMKHGIWLDVSESHAGENIKHGIEFVGCSFEYGTTNANTHYDVGAINVNTAMNDGVIRSCVFKNITANGVRVYPYGSSPNQIAPTRWTIKDNLFNNIGRYDPETPGGEGFTGSAIYYRGHDLTFDNNRVINIKRQPMDIQGPNDQKNKAKGIKVLNNHFENEYGYSDYRSGSLCLFRHVELQFINNVLICDNAQTQACAIEHKWGGSLIMTGNKVFSPFRDGLSLWASTSETLPGNIDFAVITDNYIESGSATGFAAVVITLAPSKFYGSVVINNNVVRNSVLRINKLFEGSGDIRVLSAYGNTSITGKTFFIDLSQRSFCWKHDIVGMGETYTNVSKKTEAYKIDGNMEILNGTFKLPLNTSLLSASSSNRGRIQIVEVSGEDRVYICLKGTDGLYTWKRLNFTI